MASKSQQGMALVEVMVALVLVALGLFSAAQLQARALLATDSALRGSQALHVAQDLLERVRASGQLGGEELTALRRNTALFAGAAASADARRAGAQVLLSLRWPDGRETDGQRSFDLHASPLP